MNPILQTIEQAVSLTDGLAEYTSDDNLEVLLPTKIAKALQVADNVSFTTVADTRGCYFVTYNSDIFHRFEALLGNSGYVASFGVRYAGYLKNSGFEKLVLNTLCPQNGLIRVGKAKPAITPYVLFNFAYTGDADEKRLGMASFFVNGITGVSGVEIGDALLWETDRISWQELEALPEVNFEELLDTSQKTAQKFIEAELKPWQQSLGRKLSRDEKRIKAYYNEIVAEIKAKITKKQLEGDAQQKELERIAATKGELKRKLADLQERYQLKVSTSLHSALVLWLQTVNIECELIRKKHKRLVTAVWNPYLKEIEPLRCEKTDEPVTAFYLSDTNAAIISPHAWDN